MQDQVLVESGVAGTNHIRLTGMPSDYKKDTFSVSLLSLPYEILDEILSHLIPRHSLITITWTKVGLQRLTSTFHINYLLVNKCLRESCLRLFFATNTFDIGTRSGYEFIRYDLFPQMAPHLKDVVFRGTMFFVSIAVSEAVNTQDAWRKCISMFSSCPRIETLRILGLGFGSPVRKGRFRLDFEEDGHLHSDALFIQMLLQSPGNLYDADVYCGPMLQGTMFVRKGVSYSPKPNEIRLTQQYLKDEIEIANQHYSGDD